jgi:hypothetical protein
VTRRDADPESPAGTPPALAGGAAVAADVAAPGAVLRANPRYELVVLDRLAPGEREAVLRDAEETDLYGILRPLAPAALPSIAVSCETALLFTSLRDPGPLPRFAVRRLGADVAASILPLVADGVLELRDGDGFVSGPEVLGALHALRAPEARGACAALSSEALERAAAMPGADVARLTEYLYRYNTRPLTPTLRRAHRDEASLFGWLDLRACSARAAAHGFHGAGDAAWRVWTRRGAAPRSQTYKLYVSVAVEDLPEVLRVTVELATSAAARQLKVGSTLAQLLRPDKLVVYFDGLAALEETAARLAPRIAGAGAHGVPFTAPIDAAGLLSWGMDPPEQHVWTSSGGSFRFWIAQRLAAGIVAARATTAAGDAGAALRDAAALARQRLALDGVDPATWAPSLRLFGAGGEGAR